MMSVPGLDSETAKFTQALYNSYEAYKVKEVTSRRLTQSAMMNILARLQTSLKNILNIDHIGESSEGRAINLLSIGAGKKKIFMWSQMHGDEPTATMGLLDMLSYISKNHTTPEVKKILSETSILIIPMLNPDGAERFQRRSVHGIDINRDALQLQTKEAKLLKQTRDKYSPEFGFNLHDQEPRYTVGSTGKVATIALLAPTYDYAKSDNAVRLRAKQIAASLVDIFSPFIEGHISRYDDSFEARAFGDNIQKWGTSTVLIESGGSVGDPEKMSIRKLNCVALLGICYSIATGEYGHADVSRYERLPENTKNLYDFIIRGIRLTFANGVAPVVVDVGINTEESVDGKGIVRQKNKIVDIGDLSGYSSFHAFDAKGKSVDGSEIVMEGVVDLEKLVLGMKRC
ncbi:MAG: M14 family zinc carboxypeptidase [Bacteroidota bacterium]